MPISALLVFKVNSEAYGLVNLPHRVGFPAADEELQHVAVVGGVHVHVFAVVGAADQGRGRPPWVRHRKCVLQTSGAQ